MVPVHSQNSKDCLRIATYGGYENGFYSNVLVHHRRLGAPTLVFNRALIKKSRCNDQLSFHNPIQIQFQFRQNFQDDLHPGFYQVGQKLPNVCTD